MTTTSDDTENTGSRTLDDVGEWLFKMRDYTPIPLMMLLLFTADATVISATIGTLLVVLGELIRLSSVAFIGSVSRTRNTETTGGNLIDTGPYGWVRNPLYVGNFFITFGLAVYGNVFLVVIITIIAFALQYYAIVKHEENLLIRSFGEVYDDYMQRVPAWVPKQNIGAPSSWDWPTDFAKAIRSEKRTMTAIAFMLIALMLVNIT